MIETNMNTIKIAGDIERVKILPNKDLIARVISEWPSERIPLSIPLLASVHSLKALDGSSWRPGLRKHAHRLLDEVYANLNEEITLFKLLITETIARLNGEGYEV